MGNDTVEPEASSPAGAPAGFVGVDLTVSGMHCQSCAALIEETLVRDRGVHSAAVDLGSAVASVVFDASTVSVDDLCAAVVGVGYGATPLTSGGRAP